MTIKNIYGIEADATGLGSQFEKPTTTTTPKDGWAGEEQKKKKQEVSSSDVRDVECECDGVEESTKKGKRKGAREEAEQVLNGGTARRAGEGVVLDDDVRMRECVWRRRGRKFHILFFVTIIRKKAKLMGKMSRPYTWNQG